jgi:hypothetical protein
MTDVRRVAVSSVGRGAEVERASGYVRIVDLDRGAVTFKVPVPESRWREADPNPRGGTRGARGIAVHADRFVLGTHEDVTVLDSSWRLVTRFSHPILSSVHDVLADGRGIWITCTRGDSLALFDWHGELADAWSLGTDKRLAKILGLHLLRPFDPEADYRDPRIDLQGFATLGLNGIGRAASGGVLLALGRVADRIRHSRLPFRRRGRPMAPPSFAIVEMPPAAPVGAGSGTIRLHRRDHPVDAPNHNAEEDGNLLLYNDSNRNALVAWNHLEHREVHAVPIPGDPPFARGLAKIGPDLWLVGSQKPLAIHAVDVAEGRIVRTYDLGGDPEETVYAICELPDRFDDPRPVTGPDVYAFWTRAHIRGEVTPIPN